MAWRIVIAGGGFGGFYAARALERTLPRGSARVTLVNDVNFMLYTPLLPGAAAGNLEPRHVVVPLRQELRDTELRIGSVVSADPVRKVVVVGNEDGRTEELAYDHLIVALGSVSRTLPIPGLEDHGIGFKALPEAIALRNRLISCLEIAERLEDPQERAEWLTFVFVGAGYAGLEGLAELQDFASDVLEFYPRCRLLGTRFILVEAKERVMTEIEPSLAEFGARELRSRGIDIRTGTTLDRVTDRSATLSGGEVVPTRSVVWTAGVKPTPVVAQLGLPTDRGGRIVTRQDLRVEGFEDVWAIGDAAAVPDPAKKREVSCPPTAQHAIRQGRLVGRNVAAAMGTGRVRPFTYRTKGVFVDMGQREAVASTMGIKWRGKPAWFLARTYHLAMMPGGLKRKSRLLVDWNVQLLFGRDTSELGRVGHPPRLADATGGGTPTNPNAAEELGVPQDAPAGAASVGAT